MRRFFPGMDFTPEGYRVLTGFRRFIFLWAEGKRDSNNTPERFKWKQKGSRASEPFCFSGEEGKHLPNSHGMIAAMTPF